MKRHPERIERVVLICTGSDCKKAGAKKLMNAARQCVRESGTPKQTLVARTKCTGMCSLAPIASIQPDNVWLSEATPARLRKALDHRSNSPDRPRPVTRRLAAVPD